MASSMEMPLLKASLTPDTLKVFSLNLHVSPDLARNFFEFSTEVVYKIFFCGLIQAQR